MIFEKFEISLKKCFIPGSTAFHEPEQTTLDYNELDCLLRAFFVVKVQGLNYRGIISRIIFTVNSSKLTKVSGIIA